MNPNKRRARASIAPEGATCGVDHGQGECGKRAVTRLRWPNTTLQLDMCNDCHARRMADALDLTITFSVERGKP